jgi:hypothetical protein
MALLTSREHDYYLMHTANTSISGFETMLSNVPYDVEKIFWICRNTLEHYNGINADKIDKARYHEIEINKVSDLLSLLKSKGVTDILSEIPFEKRIVSNCFNIAKLAVSLLRYKGIPARLRYAYCSYFNHKNNPLVNSEQVLVEYWSVTQQRWLRGDPSMNWEILDHLKINVEVNFLNVSKTLSKPISDVWINCRLGLWDFADYGVSLGKQRQRCGMGHVALKMAHDFACLNNFELYAFDFISPSRRFQQEINLRPYDFDRLAEILHSENFVQFHHHNKRIPLSTRPRRVLRKSPITGITLIEGKLL